MQQFLTHLSWRILVVAAIVTDTPYSTCRDANVRVVQIIQNFVYASLQGMQANQRSFHLGSYHCRGVLW